MLALLFSRFLLHPKLVLTDIRSGHGGTLSVLAAFLAVAAFSLANCLVFFSCNSVPGWISRSLLLFTVFFAAGIFYLPVVHLFAEKNLPAARVTDLLVYSGFALAPLSFALPLALMARALSLPRPLYALGVLAILLLTVSRIIAGVGENYGLSPARAVTAFLAPLLYLLLFPLVIALLAVIR